MCVCVCMCVCLGGGKGVEGGVWGGGFGKGKRDGFTIIAELFVNSILHFLITIYTCFEGLCIPVM